MCVKSQSLRWMYGNFRRRVFVRDEYDSGPIFILQTRISAEQSATLLFLCFPRLPPSSCSFAAGDYGECEGKRSEESCSLRGALQTLPKEVRVLMVKIRNRICRIPQC